MALFGRTTPFSHPNTETSSPINECGNLTTSRRAALALKPPRCNLSQSLLPLVSQAHQMKFWKNFSNYSIGGTSYLFDRFVGLFWQMSLAIFTIIALKVSRTLYAISNSRAVWKSVVLSCHPARTLLVKQLDSCTARELEDVMASYHKGQQRLGSAKQCAISKAVQLSVKSSVHHLYLAPGGRWLFHVGPFFRTGVEYVDLDASRPVWRQLIPSNPLVLSSRVPRFSFEHIEEAGHLTLHLALSTAKELTPSIHINSVSVWSITQTFDDSGLAIGLQAAQLSSFKRTAEPYCFDDVVLQGEVILLRRNDPCCCSVVRWKDADGRLNDFPQKNVSYGHSGGLFVRELFSGIPVSYRSADGAPCDG